jgi:signal transduction histidine kinase
LRPDQRLDALFGAFLVACIAAMFVMPHWMAVPFHFAWMSLAVVYGYRQWDDRRTLVLTTTVAVVTGVPILLAGEPHEFVEVPLMAAIFATMVWHAHRRRQVMEELARNRENEREFLRDASHSLRTPLTVARGHAELVRSALPPGSQELADATVVLDELRRLSRIAERVLLLAGAGHPGFLMLGPVDIDDLLSDVATRWSAAAGRSIQVRADAGCVVLADEERLRDALDALIENGLRASPPASPLTLAARAEDGDAVIEVVDHGTGIPGEDLDRIFRRFARGGHDDVAGRGGTGLGLPIVRAIVEAHGGTVTVDSVLRRGTTFRLRFGPLRAVTPAVAVATTAAAATA